jgi:hypothetical protein
MKRGPKEKEGNDESRILLDNEEHCDLCRSARVGRTITSEVTMGWACRILVGRHLEKRWKTENKMVV